MHKETKSLLRWLDEEIADAKEEYNDNRTSARNSFGHGYDDGFLTGLIHVRNYITGE